MASIESADPSIAVAPSITTSKTPNAALNVDEYASLPPSTSDAPTGFPKQTGQSLSYWLQQVRCDPLLNHRTTADLPRDADTVVIGSGLSGTLIAKHHLEAWPSKSLVVLEAREFCSGATGRNAGHCKPDQWRHYAKFEAAYGAEQAVKENGVDCDLWVGDTLDVPVSDEVAKTAREVFERYKNAGGNVGHIEVTHDPKEAVRWSRIKSAKACYRWKASTLQPWKITASIMRDNISRGANLQTHTVATSSSPTPTTPSGGEGKKRKWTIHTSRGDIACDTIVHATNGYSAALEPSLQGIISPKPHICNQFIPPRQLSGSNALKNSYGVLCPNGSIFSINPRTSADGSVMFGGSNPGQKKLDEWTAGSAERAVDDGIANVEIVTREAREFVKKELIGSDEEVEYAPGEGFVHSWSGIAGMSADGVPFVGEIPGKEGQWICAGHHGHGMARIFTAAPGLVKLMSGKEWKDTGLPDVYQMTTERLEKLKKTSGSRERIAII